MKAYSIYFYKKPTIKPLVKKYLSLCLMPIHSHFVSSSKIPKSVKKKPHLFMPAL